LPSCSASTNLSMLTAQSQSHNHFCLCCQLFNPESQMHKHRSRQQTDRKFRRSSNSLLLTVFDVLHNMNSLRGTAALFSSPTQRPNSSRRAPALRCQANREKRPVILPKTTAVAQVRALNEAATASCVSSRTAAGMCP
jgi:hypothetical protein